MLDCDGNHGSSVWLRLAYFGCVDVLGSWFVGMGGHQHKLVAGSPIVTSNPSEMQKIATRVT